MKTLLIGGNRFVGLRMARALETLGHDLHILNRTGQVPGLKKAVIYKGDRNRLEQAFLDRDWDLVIDFACFNQTDAKASLNFFKKVNRYIFISSATVYDQRPSNSSAYKEEDFAPDQFVLEDEDLDVSHPAEAYKIGKRMAEALLTQQAPFPVAHVRFPFILGPDDYTHRLEFHIEHLKRNRPICADSPEFKFSLIHADDAAQALLWVTKQTFKGPVNFASPEPLTLKQLMSRIEQNVGQRALYLSSGASVSPYSTFGDLALNCSYAESLGFRVGPLDTWLEPLIHSFMGPVNSKRLH